MTFTADELVVFDPSSGHRARCVGPIPPCSCGHDLYQIALSLVGVATARVDDLGEVAGHVLLLSGYLPDPGEIDQLRDQIRERFGDDGPLVLHLPQGEIVETLDAEQMRQLGWVRAEQP